MHMVMNNIWTMFYALNELCVGLTNKMSSYFEHKQNKIKDAKLYLINIWFEKPAVAMQSLFKEPKTAIDTLHDSSLEGKVHRGSESISVSWDCLHLTPAPPSHTWSLAESHSTRPYSLLYWQRWSETERVYLDVYNNNRFLSLTWYTKYIKTRMKHYSIDTVVTFYLFH